MTTDHDDGFRIPPPPPSPKRPAPLTRAVIAALMSDNLGEVFARFEARRG